MSTPKVSIITVVYNAKEELERTLKGLSELHYSNKEIIVIDGNSNDGTKSVIEQYALDINIWLSEEDDGIYHAMNKGLELATGDYVWFVNAGDLPFNEYTLENIFHGQEIYSDVYYGDTMIVNQDNEVMGLRRKRLPSKLNWHSLRKGMVVCHQSIIVHRSIAPRYDLSLRYASDITWVIESLKAAKSIRNTQSILSIFEEGGTSTLHRKESLKERFKIMVHYYGYLTTLFYHITFVTELIRPKYRKISKFYFKSTSK